MLFQTGATATTCRYWTGTRWRFPPSAAARTSAPRMRPCSAASRSQFSILSSSCSMKTSQNIEDCWTYCLLFDNKFLMSGKSDLSGLSDKNSARYKRKISTRASMSKKFCIVMQPQKRQKVSQWLATKTVRDIKCASMSRWKETCQPLANPCYSAFTCHHHYKSWLAKYPHFHNFCSLHRFLIILHDQAFADHHCIVSCAGEHCQLFHRAFKREPDEARTSSSAPWCWSSLHIL